MSKFGDETLQGLLEAATMEKGEVPLTLRENMLALTYFVDENNDMQKVDPELLRTLAETEDNVHNGRVAPVENTFSDIRSALLARK